MYSEKYNPNEDINYPKVGDIIDENRKVSKVTHIYATELMKLLTGKNLPDDSEHLLIVDNPDRHFLKYLVWWEKI